MIIWFTVIQVVFFYTGDVHNVIELMKQHNKWLYVQEQDFLEKYYTKRDVFILLDCDTPLYTNATQCMGGLLIIEKCELGDGSPI